MPLELGAGLEGGETLSLKFNVGNGVNLLWGETGLGSSDQRSGRIREGEDDTAELNDLEGSVLGDVSGSREKDLLALPVGVVEVSEHFSDVVDETVTGISTTLVL